MNCKICGGLIEPGYESGEKCENCFSDTNGHVTNIYEDDEKPKTMTKEEILALPITELDLDPKIINCLNNKLGIALIGDLVKKTEMELLGVKQFGFKSLEEVRMQLQAFGLDLKYSQAEQCSFGSTAQK